MTLKSPRSSTIVSPESCHVIVLLAISVYNFRDIGRGNNNKRWNDLQMSFKVVERGTNQKVVFELLLVVYSNFPRITHRFLYTSCFNAESNILPTHLYLTLNLEVITLECGDEIWRQKTRIMGLPYDEEIMIEVEPCVHSLRVWQTDGQTNIFTMTKTVLCIASRGKLSILLTMTFDTVVIKMQTATFCGLRRVVS